MAAPSRCLPPASPGAEAVEEPLALVPWLQGRCCACRIQFKKKNYFIFIASRGKAAPANARSRAHAASPLHPLPRAGQLRVRGEAALLLLGGK